MEFTYYLAKGHVNIITPGVANLSDVKNEIFSLDAKKMIRKSTFPNGFCIEMEEEAGAITLRCNRPLVDNGDGSFTAPTNS